MTRRLTVNDRDRVIAFEQSHLGMAENPPHSNRTEPGKWYGMDGSAWCAMFQSWSFYSVLGFSPFPATTSKGFAACISGAQWFKRNGLWASGDVVPKRGWLGFLKYPGDSIEHHVWLVLSASKPRDVNGIDGNSGDKVSLVRHRTSISGYGVIPYQEVGAPVPPPPKVQTSSLPVLHIGSNGGQVTIVQTILKNKTGANLVIDGDFGPKTQESVKNVQRLFKIGVDGVVGPKTWDALLYLNNH